MTQEFICLDAISNFNKGIQKESGERKGLGVMITMKRAKAREALDTRY
jgi:hypothetical protein